MKHVCILSGIHRGAVVEIGDQPVLIGGDDACGALLSDESAQGSVVEISAGSDDTLTVKTIRGTVTKNGRNLKPEKCVLLGADVMIGVGDVQIAAGDTLAVADDIKARRENRRMMMGWGGVCAACLAIFAIIGAIGGPADAYNSPYSFGAASRSADAERLRREPLAELQREVARKGLDTVLNVRRSESGQLIATGAVSPDERARWRDTVEWFDGRFGDIAMLESRLSERESGITLPFQIVSIHAAPNSRVVLQNGESFPVGSILPGGWELRQIAGMKVVIARGDRELAISF